ncbi:hypothetical protein AGMMS49992_08050 [Clostridia bacterium]|nr:hypothetical protein AGMMS49992_08050 [Clostridia bacterium]
MIMTTLSVVTLASCTPVLQPTVPTLDLYVLDVGKADCILVQFDSKWMLIDAGLEETSAAVVGTMRALGIQALLYAVATHPDKDHIGGMAAILSAFPTRGLVECPMRLDNKPSRSMRQALSSMGIPSYTMRSGDSWTVGELSVRVLAPGPTALSFNDENEASLVLMLEYGSTRIMLAADEQLGSEREMLSTYTDLHADVLKVAHHGSNKSTSQLFLEAVRPAIAIISTGERIDGKDGDPLPDPRTLERLESIGARALRTDTDGMIHIQSDGKTVSIIRD